MVLTGWRVVPEPPPSPLRLVFKPGKQHGQDSGFRKFPRPSLFPSTSKKHSGGGGEKQEGCKHRAKQAIFLDIFKHFVFTSLAATKKIIKELYFIHFLLMMIQHRPIFFLFAPTGLQPIRGQLMTQLKLLLLLLLRLR